MEFLYPVYMSGLYNSFVSLANFNLSNLFFFFFFSLSLVVCLVIPLVTLNNCSLSLTVHFDLQTTQGSVFPQEVHTQDPIHQPH